MRVALRISPGLDTFCSVAPNWSPVGRALALRTGEEEDKSGERSEEGKRRDKKGRTNRKDKRDRGAIRARRTAMLRVSEEEREREKRPRAKMERR